MKRNVITGVVVVVVLGAMVGFNAYFAPDRISAAQVEEAKKAAEKVELAKAEEAKAKEAAPADKTPAAPPAAPAEPPAPAEAAPWPATAPETFKVQFDTTKGKVVLEIHKKWAPLGVDRFFELCKQGYFNNSSFFRVVPGFVVQFGLAADPAVTAIWKEQPLQDDLVTQTNAPGTITFATAGPNTRTTQLFINLGNNARLDGMGFSPFGKVIEGLDVVQAITSQYGESPRQDLITTQGDKYISQFFPEIDRIKTVTFLK